MNIKLKKNTNFYVSSFMKAIDIDYIYSYSNGVYLLLDESMYGEIAKDVVDDQIELGLRVVVLKNREMELDAYNIDTYELVDAVNKSYEGEN